MSAKVVPLVCGLVIAGTVLIGGCDRAGMPAETTSVPQAPSSSPAEAGSAGVVVAFSQRELEGHLNLYMLANSDTFRDRCWAPYSAVTIDAEYLRQLDAVGMVAAARIKRLGGAVVPTVLERFERASYGDMQDERWRLTDLLRQSRTLGRKACIRLSKESAPTSDDDSDWEQFLRTRLSYDDIEGYRGHEIQYNELLWRLTKDAGALKVLQGDMNEVVAYLRDPTIAYPGWGETGISGESSWMRDVLAIAPATGGVSSDALKDWAQDSGSKGIRWGAILALANRGDTAAQKEIREIIQGRFPLRPKEREKWGDRIPTFEHPHFLLVGELAKSRLEDRWDLLLDLLADMDPRLLSPRAAVLVALEDYWSSLPGLTQQQARRLVVRLHWTENNQWLQTMMMFFLANHPAEAATGINP